jgi:uncharacterized RDD family membrane protein YckC
VSDASRPAPRLAVRLACAVYEGLLLFGVLACAGLLYGLLLQPPGDRPWGWPFYLFLGAVMAGYFVWFWSKGETLAMATWHLRLQRRSDGGNPRPGQALLRFAVSQLWWLPGLAALHAAQLDTERSAWWLVLGANVLAYALLTRLHPSRQYLHDVLAGTELVTLRRSPTRSGSR